MKPRLRLVEGGLWRCFSSKTTHGLGLTPKDAFDDWVYWRDFANGI